MSKRTPKLVAAVIIAPVDTSVNTSVVTVETAVDTTSVDVVAPIVAPVAPVIAAGPHVFTDPDGNAFTVTISPVITRIARAVAGIDAVVGTDTVGQFTARVAHVRAGWNVGADVPTNFAGIVLNRSPWGGNVTETQNAIYAGIAVAGVPVTSTAVVAVWRALLPVTKCDFESHTRYGGSTFAEFANGRHGGVPTVPVDASSAWIRMMGRFHATDGLSKPWARPVPVIA
jgi:hypothetical protein